MKVTARKFTERKMSFFWLTLDDGRKTYCRSFTGEFDKKTQSDARNIIDLKFNVRPQSVQFEVF
jgi:hypothetical protein